MFRSRSTAAPLLDWYTKKARPFLELHAPQNVSAIDAQGVRVEHLAKQAGEEVAVCFLGNSGVGKSTLLNSLVSEQYDILPHGGVGPLTAQATVVRYAEAPYFRATYFSAGALNKTLFVLERAHELSMKRTPVPGATEETAAATVLDEEERWEAEAAFPVVEANVAIEGTNDKVDAYQRQVRLLVRGDQQADVSVTYLVDALRLMLGNEPRWGSTPSAEDLSRIGQIRACLELAQNEGVHRERRADGNLERFLAELREHASGFLAPLIKSLEVGWNGDALRDGLVLVDLPGVGVANDEYRSVTKAHIREARAIVMVVDHRGVSEASAELLRSTGFLNRMLHDSHDPAADPVSLAVVVVKVDETADSAWLDEKTLLGKGARRWSEHFRDACGRVVLLVQNQMRQELEKLALDGPDATLFERRSAMMRVLGTLEVHPVSAPQYRLFLLGDDDAPARIKSVEESRVPELRGALRALGTAHQARCQERAAIGAVDFREHVRSAIALVEAQWQEDLRAEKEAKALREELETFLVPHQRELASRDGAFREFLRSSLPAQIESRVAEAALIAKDDIIKQLGKLEKLHWATLRATVRRGGAFVRKGRPPLDLPAELTLRFEDPIAVVWSKYILASLRRRTGALGEDYVSMVREVVEWARGQHARVQVRLVEVLHESLIAQTKDLSSVGKEAVDELKSRVHAELGGKLEKKIRQKCHAFVNGKKDVGPGVKSRILELFRDELAAGVTEIAQDLATTVLLENYNVVQHEIKERFAGYRNPLDTARDALVQSHEDGVRRSDAQKRRRVLTEVGEVLAAMPGSAG